MIIFQDASGYGGQRPPRILKSKFLEIRLPHLRNCHVDFTTIHMQPELTQATGLTMVFGLETGSYAPVWAHIRSISDNF